MDLPRKHSFEHYQRKANRYSTVLRLLFNVKIDESTRNRWSDLIAFSRSVDTYLDEGDRTTLMQRTTAIARLLDNQNAIATQFPSLAMDQLGADTYTNFATLGKAILDINIDYKQTASLQRYASLRRVEGRLYARFISSVATPKVTAQPGYARFSHLFETTGEITNLINSFHDIHEDYANGEITVVPNNLTQIRLVGHVSLAAFGITPIY